MKFDNKEPFGFPEGSISFIAGGSKIEYASSLKIYFEKARNQEQVVITAIQEKNEIKNSTSLLLKDYI